LTSLLVGSEGTLGIITEITVALRPAPLPAQTLVASFESLTSAGHAIQVIAASGITPSMLEILDGTTVRAVDRLTRMGLGDGTEALLLVQSDDGNAGDALASIEATCTAHGAVDVAVSSDSTEADMLLQARRSALPALERLGDWLLDDVAVPRSAVTDLMASVQTIAARSALTIGVFGHAGDGNLHPTIIYDDSDPVSRAAALSAFDAITARALELGGTITGEHGVGRLKSNWLAVEQGPVTMAVHRAVKNALDPTGILNPAAVLTL
ncbi:FAD-binding oxidoreductase, partial [Rhodococcus fascians]|nr:FAD-binding oxidoreductase [Rhodococcus fascians]